MAAWAIVAALILEIFFGLLRPVSGPLAMSGWDSVLIVAIEVIAFCLPPIVAIRASGADWRTTFRLNRSRWRFAAPVIVAAPALSLLLFYVQQAWVPLWKGVIPMGASETINEALTAHQPHQVIVLVLLIGLVPAISEELFFRGFLQSILATHWQPVLAVLASAGMFALLHADLVGLPTYLILGIWFGYLAQKTGSLIWPILAHLLHNSMAIVARYELSAGIFAADIAWMPAVCGLVLITVVLILRAAALRSPIAET